MASIRRRVAAPLISALLAAILTFPFLSQGACGDNGDCVSYSTNIVGIPVPPWLWIPTSLTVGLAVVLINAIRARQTPRR